MFGKVLLTKFSEMIDTWASVSHKMSDVLLLSFLLTEHFLPTKLINFFWCQMADTNVRVIVLHRFIFPMTTLFVLNSVTQCLVCSPICSLTFTVTIIYKFTVFASQNSLS